MKAPPPFIVVGTALTVALVNAVTIRVPSGTNATGYVIGYLVTPVLLAAAYAVWYRRRYPKS